jgi:hypothetical protein
MFGNFMNSNNSGSYPITLNSFVVIRNDIPQNCNNLRELFKFIYWTKTDANALARPNTLGYSQFSNSLNEQVINFLLTATCNGNQILYTKILPQHGSVAYTFYLSLSLILMAISLFLGATWQYLNKSRCSKVVVIYQAILLVGVCCTYLSIIFWYLVPDGDDDCLPRIWLTAMGYSLILTAMFERTWQIKRVYGKVLKGKNLATTVNGFFEVGGGIVIILSIQLIIMIVWTVVDPFHAAIVYQPGGKIAFEGTYTCVSDHANVWLLIEAIYFAVLLVTLFLPYD